MKSFANSSKQLFNSFVTKSSTSSKSMPTYENRLASLETWIESFVLKVSRAEMIAVEYSDIEDYFMTQCTQCLRSLSSWDCKELLTIHLQDSLECSLALQVELKAQKVVKQVEKLSSNGSVDWHRYMNDLLFNFLNDICQIHLNDILIYSKFKKKHIVHVSAVLKTLKKTDLQVNKISTTISSSTSSESTILSSISFITSKSVISSTRVKIASASCSLALQVELKTQKVVEQAELKKIIEMNSVELIAFEQVERRVKVVELKKNLDKSSSIAYEERLANLAIWDYSTNSIIELLVVDEFSDTSFKSRVICNHCSLAIWDWDWKNDEESLTKHLQESSHCSLVLQLEKKTSEDVRRVELKAQKVAKFTLVASDIEYFDTTLLCDIQKFDLHCEIANFVQQLRQCQHQYRESNLLTLLFECLRDSALTWYRQQSESEIVKKNLSEWLEALIIAFSTKSFAIQISVSNSSSSFSPQYHSCVKCFAFFSSLRRLLQHIQKVVCQKIICKHCEGVFESNNKLHEHVRQYHTKKVVKAMRSRFNKQRDKSTTTSSISSTNISTTTSSSTTPKIAKSRPVTSPEPAILSSTPPVTSAATTSERSSLPLPTLKITPKRVETASSFCPLVNDLSTPLATPTSMLRKPQKPYLTINDLHRMFAGKLRSFGLPQHQKRRSSSQSFGPRPSSAHQSRITSYFLPVVNQKPSISQGPKSSKPKSFQQYTPAEPIPLHRPALPALPEKSAFSSYKITGISKSFKAPQSRSSTRSSFARPTFTSSPLPRFPQFSRFSPRDLHVCCICFDHSSFRNGLFNYRSLSQQYPSIRRSFGGMG